MANSKSSDTSAESDFVLKHRIAGAAFLLFFGALILPWVLGAPDSGQDLNAAIEQVKNEAARPATQQANLLADELSAAVASEEVAIEEQVYISKITPVGTPATDAAATEPSDARQSDSTQTTPANGSVTASVQRDSTPMPDQSEQQPSQTSSATPSQTPPSGVSPTQDIEVGWVVQVGVFTDKKGAGRVVDDLRSKGFAPSTTIVDTNRGKATGTRIWLGPYAQRVDAAKAKAELTQKTGEAGFIRAYP